MARFSESRHFCRVGLAIAALSNTLAQTSEPARGQSLGILLVCAVAAGASVWRLIRLYRTANEVADITQMPFGVPLRPSRGKAMTVAIASLAIDAMLAKPLTASTLFDTVSSLRPGGADALAPVDVAAVALAGEGALTNVRILVVDDNAMNQQLALLLLGAVGAIVAVADSGQAAIAAVCTASTPYDLVLMDIQMPDMDGYADTAGIRAAMGPNMPPIVAMTANAMASDRAAALAAGMVDHVGKPFDLEQLIAVIQRHASRPLALLAPSAAQVFQAAPATLDMAAALRRVGGNDTVYQMALRGFRGEMEKLTRQLTAAIENDSADQAAAALHVVRGLAGVRI
jgi:two-component system sensor histidine kinase/response regulator